MSRQFGTVLGAGIPIGVVLALFVITLLARRRGYNLGGRVFARCRRGHLFTSVWVPGASLKAIRLGWLRIQWCPVGRHWTLVRPLRETELTEAERREAQKYDDGPIP